MTTSRVVHPSAEFSIEWSTDHYYNPPGMLFHSQFIRSSATGFAAKECGWALFFGHAPDEGKHTDRVWLGLSYKGTIKEDVFATVTLSIPSTEWEKTSANVCVPANSDYELEGVVVHYTFPRSFFLDLLHGDDGPEPLVLLADVKLTVGVPQPVKSSLEVDGLCQSFGASLAGGSFSDFTLVASDGKVFPVHKFVLASRSKVFAAMLTHDTVENKSAICHVDDIDGVTLAVLLDFVYSAATPGLSEMAESVLAAADKYELLDLKKVCGDILISAGLTVDNAARLLILADRHGVESLKVAVFTYLVAGHGRDFRLNSGLKTVMSYSEELLGELFDFCTSG